MTNTNRISFTNNVKGIINTRFGKRVVLDIPDSIEAVVLCYNKKGLKPFSICLPHQIYLDKIEKAIENKGSVTVTAIPINTSDSIEALSFTDIIETELIEQYNSKKLDFEKVENQMSDHFERIVDKMIKTAKTKTDFNEIRQRLNCIPKSDCKDFLLKKILLVERHTLNDVATKIPRYQTRLI